MSDGDAVDYNAIEQDIASDDSQYEVCQWRYDGTFAEHLAQNLLNVHGVNVSPMGQTGRNYNEPIRLFLRAVKQGRVLHDGSPSLAWQMGNLIIKRDTRDLWMPAKGQGKQKIDAAVATLMAFEAAIFFESQGVPGII